MIFLFTLLWVVGAHLVLIAAWFNPWILALVVGQLLMWVANGLATTWMDKHEDYKIED